MRKKITSHRTFIEWCKRFYLEHQWILTGVFGLLSVVIFYDIFRKLFEDSTFLTRNQDRLNGHSTHETEAYSNEQNTTLIMHYAQQLFSPGFLLAELIHNFGNIGVFAQATPVNTTDGLLFERPEPMLKLVGSWGSEASHVDDVVLSASGDLAYVTDRSMGLMVINISNPSTPILQGSVTTSWVEANGVGLGPDANLVYVADWYRGLKIINVSNASSPVLKESLYISSSGSVTLSKKSWLMEKLIVKTQFWSRFYANTTFALTPPATHTQTTVQTPTSTLTPVEFSTTRTRPSRSTTRSWTASPSNDPKSHSHSPTFFSMTSSASPYSVSRSQTRLDRYQTPKNQLSPLFSPVTAVAIANSAIVATVVTGLFLPTSANKATATSRIGCRLPLR